MERHALRDHWAALRDRAKTTWDQLTDDDLDRIAGRRQVLIGKLQERYGTALSAAEQEVDSWIAGLEERSTGR